METPNSIVISKESNGNVLITPEGTPYTVKSNSLISKELDSVLVRQAFAPSAVIRFTVDAVEKVISTDGGEVFISDVDTLFSELNNFFFFEPLASGGSGGGLPDNYRVVAGVIRNTGSGWDLITTGDHAPMNVDSVDNTTVQVNINYPSLNATEVVTFLIAPDETYAGLYEVGASVGLTVAAVKIKELKVQQETHLITHTGSGNFTFPASLGASSSYSTSLGRLRIYHDEATDNNFPQFFDLPSTSSEQTLYIPRGSSLAGNRTDVYLYNVDGTQKSLTNPDVNRFYYTRSPLAFNKIDKNPNDVVDAGGNFWFIGIMKIS